MRGITSHPASVGAFVAAAALIFAACSESPTTPQSLRTPIGASFDSGAALSIPGGSTSIGIASSATTQYCGHAYGVFAPVLGGTTFTGVCGNSQDLQSNLTTIYNPGWDANFGGTSWIGPTGDDANSNEYRAHPGTYDFQTTFSIPAGATGVGLNLKTMGDNSVLVFLNGHALGGNNPIQDCPSGGPCYWFQSDAASMFDNNQAHFNIGGTNTIEIFLIDTRIGVGPAGAPAPPAFNGSSCELGPQVHGELGFGGASVTTAPDHEAAGWNSTDCLNPTGLDFVGTAFYTPAPVNHGCTLGFWKTHENQWPSAYTPSTTVGSVFSSTGTPSSTFDAALSFSGGPTVQDAKDLLLKQAVAALLNAATTGMNYPLTTSQVISEVNAALTSGNRATILAEATRLEGFNSLEGPLC